MKSLLALYDDLPAKYNNKKVRLTSNETGAPVTRPQGEVLREPRELVAERG